MRVRYSYCIYIAELRGLIFMVDFKMLSLKSFILLFGLCTYHLTSSVVSVGAQQENLMVQCGREINDESEARQCLNVTDTNINPPSPVILEATAEGDFICKDKPLLYSFSCTLYGFNLIWYFDNVILTAFQANDTDHLRTFQYPSSAPIYNITVVLTQVSTATVSRFNAPFCVSVLTVQPFNENEIQVLPFAVSCQTHCEDANKTAVCQTKHYNVAAKPRQPRETSGNIQKFLDNDQSESSGTGTGIAAIASLDWNPPENHNETAIDFYELTLIGTPNLSTTFFYRATTQQTFSSKYVLSERNYTAARITAVDSCEQRSESSQIMLSINDPLSIGPVGLHESNDAIKNRQHIIDILTGILAIMFALLIVMY